FQKKQAGYDTIFFFPFYHTGGAEKVHLQIAAACATEKSVIYFTRHSVDDTYLNEFKALGCTLIDISRYTDRKPLLFLNFIFRGLITAQINKQRVRPVVFNGQSNFGYKVSPWLRRSIPQVDLIHALNTFSRIRVPFLRYYRVSLTVSQEIIDKHNALYNKLGVPQSLQGRLIYINYGIELPSDIPERTIPEFPKVLFVGRGSPEKRIPLAAEIAAVAVKTGMKIQFRFAGPVAEYIPEPLSSFCEQLGTVGSKTELEKVYRAHDILLLTSETESGPLVVLEAMANGLAVMATPVGIVPGLRDSGMQGLMFSSVVDEKKIVEEAIRFLRQLPSLSSSYQYFLFLALVLPLIGRCQLSGSWLARAGRAGATARSGRSRAAAWLRR
ncbi:MAG: glycosyltransferase, partial [Sphingobacteriales bacterium]